MLFQDLWKLDASYAHDDWGIGAYPFRIFNTKSRQSVQGDLFGNFLPLFDQYGSSVAKKVYLRLSRLYSTFELPSSPMLAVPVVQTHCLFQKFISVVCHFQSAKKTKVLRRWEPNIVCTQHLNPPLHFSVGCVACANSLPFASRTNTVGELSALCETTINASGCVLDGLCVLKEENIYLDVFDNVCKNNWCALPSLKGKNQRSRPKPTMLTDHSYN